MSLGNGAEIQSKEDEKSKHDDSDTKPPSHHGQLIIDAVVALQDIKFPTDLDLLDQAREEAEGLLIFFGISNAVSVSHGHIAGIRDAMTWAL